MTLSRTVANTPLTLLRFVTSSYNMQPLTASNCLHHKPTADCDLLALRCDYYTLHWQLPLLVCVKSGGRLFNTTKLTDEVI